MVDKVAADDPEAESDSLFREDQSALFDALSELMEEREMSEDELVPLLIDAVYHFRAIAYVVSTAKPSEGGLRMDLDRFRKLVDDVHRDYKKNAGEVVRSLVTVLETLAAEEGDDRGEPPAVLSEGTGR